MRYTIPAPPISRRASRASRPSPPATLANALAEAHTRVDTSWLPDDFTVALMLLAAHTLTLDGLRDGGRGRGRGRGGARLYGDAHGRAQSRRARPWRGDHKPSVLGETTYGRRFLALLKVNQPAVQVP